MLLFYYAILSGIMTVLSPCLLSIFIVTMALGVGGSRWKPWFIVGSFIVSFSIFGSVLLTRGEFFGIGAPAFDVIAGNAIVVLGLLRLLRQTRHNRGRAICTMDDPTQGHAPHAHVGRGIAAGTALGMVWTPCGGPILASVMSLSSIGSLSLSVGLMFGAYAVGVGLVLLVLVRLMNAMLSQLSRVQIAAQSVMFLLGTLTVFVGFLFVTGNDILLQKALFDVFPFASFAL